MSVLYVIAQSAEPTRARTSRQYSAEALELEENVPGIGRRNPAFQHLFGRFG
jgi:hypothetical protein